MRNNFIKAVILVLISTFVSCKNDGKKIETTEEKVVVDNKLNVVMNLIVEKDDNFQIYYTEDGSDNFTADKFVNIDVKGSPTAQEIVFKIPEDVLPRQLRFDIGSNKEQKDIKIISFKLKYFDKIFEVQGKDFWVYFGNNTSIKYSRENAIATPLTKNAEGYDPIFGGTSNLTKELDKIIK